MPYDLPKLFALSPSSLTLPGENPPAALLRLEWEEHFVVLVALRDPSAPAGVLEDADAAALLADLLRPEWTALARPLELPILQDGVIFRGFTLVREATVGALPSQWRADVLVPAPLEADFHWPRLLEALSDFHCSVFPTPS